MRDHLRELDLARACGDDQATITDAPNGAVVVTMSRDALDALLSLGSSHHWSCYDEDDLDDARAEGYAEAKAALLALGEARSA